MNYLIDPLDVTHYDRTDAELELFFLFCQTVAGKTARVQARLLNDFLSKGNGGAPFDVIRDMDARGVLLTELKESRLGQYNRLEAGFRASLDLNLRTASLAELKSIKGVGNKTARFFVLHSRPDQKIAVLDTHILKYLGSCGYDVPKATPGEKDYLRLEKIFLELADKSGKSVADFDLELWTQYSTRSAK